MDTFTDFPQDKTLVDLFEEQVLRTPDNIAVEFEGEELSYRELNSRANQLAHYLISLGVVEDSLVPICLSRSLDMVVSALGVLKAGGAYVPIDPEYPIDRIEYTLNDTNGVVIIAESDGPLLQKTCNSPLLYLDLHWKSILEESKESPHTQLQPQHLAYVIYTSGSTGRPKGVMIEHRSLVQLFADKCFPFSFTDKDVWTMFHSFCFDFSVWEMYGALLSGGKLILIPPYLIKDSLAYSELLINRKVTILNQTPSAFYVIQENLLEKIKTNFLRYIFLGGESLNPSKLMQWKSTFPSCDLVNLYGITETAIVTTYQPISLSDCESNTSAIGKPFPNYKTFVLNEKSEHVVPGEEGELHVGGPGLARGYLNMPELTTQRFISNPFNDSQGLIYRTGDLVIMDKNDRLEYISRIDDQVKIRGFRIELREIENVLLENNDIQQAIVLARDDEFGTKRLIAYIVSKAAFKKDEISNFLDSRVPNYMIPQFIIPINEVPLTSNGKIDKKNLPEPKASELVNTIYVAPKNKTQRIIIESWKKVLKLSKIGINDNFFELGGNSLLAQSFVLAISNQGISLPITALYQYPTASGLESFLNSGQEEKKRNNNNNKKAKEVAVIAMSGRFPGAKTIDQLWENLKAGKETIDFFTDDDLDPSISLESKTNCNYVKARGIISGVNEFDHKFFSINPKMAKVMDPQQRKFLEVAWESLESAGYVKSAENHSIGVFAGCGANTYFNNNIYPNKGLVNEIGDFNLQTLSDKDFLATRVAYALNLKGPAVTVQSACSTSLLAIAQAVESIRSGQCDMALAGGITIQTPHKVGHFYEEGAILSNDGHTRTFDSDAQGTVFCDGAAAVLLKDKEQAITDGDTIYAVIKGIGVSNDGGNKGSFTAPSTKGQAAAIRTAIEDANIDPATISYVEAHGTATPIGDPIEIEGLKMAFGEQIRKQYCAIGSIKSNMGHLIHAAGAAGFIKTCLSLYHKQIPPSINFKNANPLLNLDDSPFYVNQELSDWNPTDTRKAGVSSFGVGGTNVHIILEEDGEARTKSAKASPIQLITWSAKSEDSMLQFGNELNRYVDKNPKVNLGDLAYTLQTTRAEFKHRSFIVTDNLDSGKNLIGGPSDFRGDNKLDENYDQLVFVFPGQGAQYLKMGYDLYLVEPVYREAVDECAALLKLVIDEDIRDILFSTAISDDGNKQKLNDTYYTQPSLFITGYALAKLWMSWGIKPDVMIGHSIGEFVAAHLAGIFSLKDALFLIGNRAKLMRNLPKGNMLAVRLRQEDLLDLLPSNLSIAAVNSPMMTVVAGTESEITRFAELLGSKNIAAKTLNTSHAFHSSMMEPIVSPFEEIVSKIRLNPPSTPIVSTLTGTWLQDQEATRPLYWARHLRETVQFSKAIDTLIAGNKRMLALECGPKNSSTLFIRQQTNNVSFRVFPSLDPLPGQNERISFLKAAGNLWINGAELDWKQLYSSQSRKKINDLPNYSFERTVCWIEPLLPVTPIQSHTIYQNSSNSPDYLDESQTDKNNMRKTNLIEKLKEILENAAGIETHGVDPKASFLEIGLDSLLLTQLALTLKKEFSLPITFRRLTEEYNSLDLLAEYLDANLEKDAPDSSPIHLNQQALVNVDRNGSQNVSSESSIDLISQQIQLLAQQVAALQNGESSKAVSTESDVTPEEAIELKKPFGATAKIERQSQELTPRQRSYLDNLIARYNEKTKSSKSYTQEYRSCMADPRVVSGFRPNTKELVYQLVVKKSEGSYLWDIDGNKYIDMLNGFGSTMLGYQPDFIKKALHEQIEKGFEIGPQHELAGEVSELICEFTKHERAALCNTGSEAVLGAMRVARTVTGKNLIVAFSGSYHGIMDEALVRGTKKLKTFPAASGILSGNVQNMLILEYGAEESLAIIRSRKDEIAAVLVEPVQSRRPEFQPISFLKSLRSLTLENDIALIFDEVITGFRMHPGGAQALFDIKADIATYGKVVGGGMPIGVIAGSRTYMDALDGGYWEYGNSSIPEIGVTYFAGTFVRHPLTLAAAKAILLYMKEKGPRLQEDLNHKTQVFTSELQKICEKYNLPIYIARFGSLWKIKYKEEYPYSELLFALMREKEIHIWDGFPCFLVESHSKDDLDFVVQQFEESIIDLIRHDFLPVRSSAPIVSAGIDEKFSLESPPVAGALLGKDAEGNPAWFIADDNLPGKYLQVTP